ncbi:MAG: phthiotriol/phenolphthiotriol dimycocerosates methyltransferase [Mycobacterium sp.]|uniref:phthiotriol/phenolphthiotriol dimycocerosates methyltransferase n=1 Tax=Mycobacterium sp. TaxID=1785 RepID=UPI003F9DAD54
MSVIDRLTANPLVEKLKAKYGYPLGTRLMRLGGIIDEMLFLNYGYEEEPPMAIPLEASDEPNRLCIQQYHRTATQADLGGKRVLEVSCGHGGGASYLFRTLHPASYTGLDRNGAAIAFCRRRHSLPGLDFVHGDAQNLPFPDQSFDAVINVEASHCYPQFPRFLAEVARVLRPGGHFLYTDLRHRTAVAEWEAALAECPMRVLSCEIINEQVLRAIDKNSQRLLELIDRRVPKVLRGVARAQTGLEGELFNRDTRSGDLSYRIYCLAKD